MSDKFHALKTIPSAPWVASEQYGLFRFILSQDNEVIFKCGNLPFELVKAMTEAANKWIEGGKEPIMLDLDGKPIHEGDRVWAFPARFETTKIEEGVYEEHRDRPLPTPDTPCFKGSVYWSDDMLAWYVRLTWHDPSWETNPCAVMMGGGHYLYQVQP